MEKSPNQTTKQPNNQTTKQPNNQTTKHQTTVLVVGASSGVGWSCVQHLCQTDRFRIFAASRSCTPELAQISCYIAADVTSDDSVQQMVDRVQSEAGKIDVLIHAAGYALAGPIEETSIEEAQQQLDTNFWGTVRVNRAVLPSMRQHGSGQLINIGSLAGMVPLPFQAYYSASKFALEAFSEALRFEVAPFGIHVNLVQPGDLNTEFTARRKTAAGSDSDSPYCQKFSRCMENIRKFESQGQSPDQVARVVLNLITRRQRQLRKRVSKPFEELVLALRRFGLMRLYDWILRKSLEK